MLAGRDGGGHDLAADEPLELGRCATGGDTAVIEHDDVVGEAVRLLQVLGGQHHRGASLGQARRRHPTATLGPSGRGRWSVRRGTAPRGSRRGWRPGRCGAGTRPITPRRDGRPRRRGRADRSARRPVARACRPSPASRPTSSRFSRPVRNSSNPAYWPVTPMRRRTSGGALRRRTRRPRPGQRWAAPGW